ncbi:MAG: D-aminoacylase [Trueperaceae bacterium]
MVGDFPRACDSCRGARYQPARRRLAGRTRPEDVIFDSSGGLQTEDVICSRQIGERNRMFDIVIRNGLIVDGAGSPSFEADIAIKDGRIATVGSNLGGGKKEIDASGQVVAPGFIDIHSHSDFTVLVDPLCSSKIRQGITTELNGNCGWSAAPLRGEGTNWIQEKVRQLGLPTEFPWDDVKGYLGALEESRPAMNMGILVGFGNLRVGAMGYDARPATGNEIGQMQADLRSGLADGAFGLSSGLYFSPESAAEASEVTAVASVLPEFGGLYTAHIRDEGAQSVGLLAAVDEAIAVGVEAGVPVQLSHLKALGPKAWGLAGAVLQRMDEARANGVDVAGDQYPYTETGGNLHSALVPKWALEGGRAGLTKRLEDPSDRRRIRDAVTELFPLRGGPSRLMVRACAFDRSLQGRTLSEIADDWKIAPEEVVLKMLAHENVKLISMALNEDDVETFMKHPNVMMSSDGMVLADTGVLSAVHTHPRTYGAFPRVLAEYVRKRSVLTLENAIYKMTGLPARRLGLEGRGELQEGNWADVVILSPDDVQDLATLQRPHVYPRGIQHVIVNGGIAVENGAPTSARTGQVLRHAA